MTRVQVTMESELHKQVKSLAKRGNISTSKFIRDIVKTQIVKQKKQTAKVLMKAFKNAKTGLVSDLSTNDDYLYASKVSD